MISVIVTVTPGNYNETIETREETLGDFLKKDPKVLNIIRTRLGGGNFVVHLNGDKHSIDSSATIDSWADIGLSKDVKGASN